MSNRFSPVSFECFTPEQVQEINKEIKKNVSIKQNSISTAQNVSKIGKFFNINCSPILELVHSWLYQCQEINRRYFGLDIYWDFHLDNFNYNVYGLEGEYGWHIDAGTSIQASDMKLTCLLNLSEESYEGGKFCAINTPEEIKFDSGMGLIINSLVAHKVTPIVKGERITLTYWGLGPTWK